MSDTRPNEPKNELAQSSSGIQGISRRFSTWAQEQANAGKEQSTVRVVPWLPFAALVGALVTVFLALITMLAINHKPIWPSDGVYAFVQPASILSLFLSGTAILAAYALAEGVIVTWWCVATTGTTHSC